MGEGIPSSREGVDRKEVSKMKKMKKKKTELTDILDERGARYGAFVTHARITQMLKKSARQFSFETGGVALSDDMTEALDMIFHKIGRILNGDPTYSDSWHDIAGYAKLVGDRLDGATR